MLFDELRKILRPYSTATPNLDPRKFTTIEEAVYRRTADSQGIDDVLDREELGPRGRDRVIDRAVICTGQTHL
jgi:hypothetical protein